MLKIKFSPEGFNNYEIHNEVHNTHWPLEVWVRGLYNSWWFCVHKLSMFIYLSIRITIKKDNTQEFKLQMNHQTHEENNYTHLDSLFSFSLGVKLKTDFS